MATTNLTINLGVATGKMAKGFSAAKGQIQSFTASVKTSMLSGLAPFLTMLGGAFSIRAFTNFISNAQKAIDKIAKLSVGLGYTTEQLSSYELAARLSGMELDEFANITKRMIKSVADANNGLSTQVRAFETLGLDARKMANLSTDEKFKAIADSIQRLGWSTKTAGAAMDIFGSRIGPKLAAMLVQGSKGIEQMQDEAKRLGLTFDGIDAAKVEMANDSMTKFKATVEGLGRKIAVELSPMLLALSEMFTGIGMSANQSNERIALFSSDSAEFIAIVLDIAWALAQVFKGLQIFINLVIVGISGLVEKIAFAAANIVEVANMIAETEIGKTVENGLRSIESAVAMFKDDMSEVVLDEWDNMTDPGRMWGEDFLDRTKEAANRMSREAKKVADERQKFSEAMSKFDEEEGKKVESIISKEEEAFRKVAMADLDLGKPSSGSVISPSALQQNTLAAYEAIAKANSDNMLVKITEEVAKNTKRIADGINYDSLVIIPVET